MADAVVQKFKPPEFITSENQIELEENEYKLIANLMFEKSGVYLDQNKIPMIQARLIKRLGALRLSSFKEYCSVLRSNNTEIIEFVNALTTHKTDFFREMEHFEIMRQQILPSICRKDKSHKLRVWSAACSSGEEVYTLAIVLSEFFSANPQLGAWDFKILGTDIDTNVITKAEQGMYNAEVVSTIRPDLLQKYFSHSEHSRTPGYKVRPALSSIIKFRWHNLLEDLSTLNGLKFQIVFLRNVLIYFKDETREYVINKLYDAILPGGYLFVGHSEPLSTIKHKFTPLRSAIYKKE